MKLLFVMEDVFISWHNHGLLIDGRFIIIVKYNHMGKKSWTTRTMVGKSITDNIIVKIASHDIFSV